MSQLPAINRTAGARGSRRMAVVLRAWLGLSFVIAASAQVDHMRRGVEFLEKGESASALAELQQAGRLRPYNGELQNLIGIALSQLNRLDEANEHYSAAIRLKPMLATARKNLGFNYMRLKQYAAASTELRAALTLDPNDRFAQYYAGMVELATSHSAEALNHFARCRDLIANDLPTSFEAAMASLRLNRTKDALELIAPVEAKLTEKQVYDLAVQLAFQHEYPAAIERFRRLSTSDPRSWTARFNLAVALIQAQHPGDAIPLLEQVAAERPTDASVLSLLGSAREAAGDTARALDAYQRALAADPESSDRYLDYTRLLMELDRYDESSQLLLDGLKFVKDSYALQMRLGSVRMTTGDYERARAAFAAALQEHPEIPLAYVAMARSYFKQGRDAEAVKVLAEAHEKLPPDFLLEYYLGLELSRVDRNAEAATAFERSIGLNANVAEPHYELGRLYLRLDRLKEASAQLLRVIELAPGHANAYYQLSRIYGKLGATEKAHAMAERTRQLKQQQREDGLSAQRKRLEAFQPVAQP